MRLGFRSAVVLFIALAPHTTAAQDLVAAPTFDVASVRPNELGARSFLLAYRNGRFTARYHTLKELIRVAYNLTESQVLGAPAWLDVERFDVLGRHLGTQGADPQPAPRKSPLPLGQHEELIPRYRRLEEFPERRIVVAPACGEQDDPRLQRHEREQLRVVTHGGCYL